MMGRGKRATNHLGNYRMRHGNILKLCQPYCIVPSTLLALFRHARGTKSKGENILVSNPKRTTDNNIILGVNTTTSLYMLAYSMF